jgi:hypothetical protein
MIKKLLLTLFFLLLAGTSAHAVMLMGNTTTRKQKVRRAMKKLLLAIALLGMLPLSAGAVTLMCGNTTTAGATGGNFGDGLLRASKFTVLATGPINVLRIYSTLTGGNVHGAVYANSASNTPAALLAETASTAQVAGWQDIWLTSTVNSTIGDTVWLTIESSSGTPSFYYTTVTDTPPNNSRYTCTHTYGAGPATFGTVANPAARLYCIYALDNTVAAYSGPYFHASPGGSDIIGNGSIGNPWFSPTKINSLSAGQTLYLRGGSYFPGNFDISVSGNSTDGYVTLAGYPGETAILDGTGNNAYSFIAIGSSRSWIKLSGLTIANVPYDTTWSNFPLHLETTNHISDIVIENCIFKNNYNGRYTLSLMDTGGGEIDNITISGCEFSNNSVAATYQEVCHLGGNTQNFKIINNVVHDNDYIGIVVTSWITPQGKNGLISGNVVYNNRHSATYNAVGIYVGEVSNVLVENNIIYGNDNGLVFSCEHQGNSCTSNIGRKNLVYSNRKYGLGIGGEWNKGTTDYNHIYNNTLYQNNTFDGYNIQVLLGYYLDGGHNKITNNIFHYSHPGITGYALSGRAGVTLTATAFNFDYNCWLSYPTIQAAYGSWNVKGIDYLSFSSYQSVFNEDTNSIYADPLLDVNHNLTISSPCINSGHSLTYATVASTGATLTVEDAGYFTDGYSGLFTGDLLKIGSYQYATITAINGNSITVNANVSVSAGDPVTLPYNGSAPDIGYSESFFSAPVVYKIIGSRKRERNWNW